MSCTRSKIVAQAQAWVGLKESDGSFTKIIDIYNSHKPLARNYKLKLTDAWCAGTASALAIACGATDIFPTEVSCGKLIELAQAKGIWIEADNHIPSPADFILYDWQDTTGSTGENKGWPDHIGIVEKVVGNNITVIEGNYKNAVSRRMISVNAKFIRGYIVPKYDAEDVVAPATKEVKATSSAKSFLKTLSGTYKVTATSLNVRHGAGITAKKMVAIPNGTKVKCYGYYTTYLGVKWLYIQFTYQGVQYTGFASSNYLKK